MSEAQDLELLVTEARVNDLDLETFYGLDSSPKANIDFVAHFVSDGNGAWLPKPEAVKVVVRGRKIGDIEDIVNQLRDAMENMAVPKE